MLTYISTSIPTDLFLNFVTSITNNTLDDLVTINGDYGVCCLIFNNASLANISDYPYGILTLANTN